MRIESICLWWLSSKDPVCGEPAIATVPVNNSVIQATIPVCRKHKATYNQKQAQQRIMAH